MRTTININNDLLEKLKSAAELMEINTHDLIQILLNSALNHGNQETNAFKGIRYQDADPEQKWQKLHVKFAQQTYEQGLDVRKFFKVSVSLFIALAISLYLDVIIQKYTHSKEDTLSLDNYPTNYLFIVKSFDDVQGFIVLWGIPRHKHLKNLIQ